MKKLLLFIAIVAMSHTAGFAQGCLPEGITFTSQTQIDSFQVNYPGCTEILGDVIIDAGDSITNLDGLNMIASIGGSLSIGIMYEYNSSLTNLQGLTNLTSIGGALVIAGNSALISLSGLENISPFSISNLTIANNQNLSDCAIQSICNYLANPGGVVAIYNNASGCSNPPEIASACGFAMDCLPHGNYYLSSQYDVDNFQNNYPDCSEIQGDMVISGLDISNLTCLNKITSISGTLQVYWNNLYNFTGLENLLNIGGDFLISYCHLLQNLSGLGNLDSIGGGLDVIYNESLINLSGINSLSHLGGLTVSGNDSLQSLEGLEGITSVNGILIGHYPYMGGTGMDHYNYSLTTLAGLNNLTNVNGNFYISDNFILSDLSCLSNLSFVGGELYISYTKANLFYGLNNLDSLGGNLKIFGNDSLLNLTALENLLQIGGDLSIGNNLSLTDISGLAGINPASVINLSICNNPSLADCNAQSICNYLAAPNGIVDIYDNANGCASPPQVAEGCGITLPCLPYGNYYFFTQEDIDNFQDNYPGCTDLAGDISFQGSIINNLYGLNTLTSIGGSLSIGQYDSGTSLTDFTGLNNLAFIGGDFNIVKNNFMTSTAGLENLTTVGGKLYITNNNYLNSLEGFHALNSLGSDLYIAGNSLTNLSGLDSLSGIDGDLSIVNNTALTSIQALENLTTISGLIDISHNTSLQSLIGIDNVDASSINMLRMHGNYVLSTCEVQSICSYLASPDCDVMISDNAPGCNSQQEVEEACGIVGVHTGIVNEFSIYPNPSAGFITIETPGNSANSLLTILNLSGQEVMEKTITEPITQLDISHLPAGIYFVRLANDKTVETVKLVKH